MSGLMRAPVPHSLADVTPGWLAGALADRFPGISVRRLEIVEIIHGTATKVRLRADHDGGRELPEQFCLKAGFEEHSDAHAANGVYAREARFFREIKDSVGAPAPRWWWADFELDSQRGAVLMEDLAKPGVRFCRATEPLTVDQVNAALAALVPFHAAWLGLGIPDEWPWLELSIVEPSPSASYFRGRGPEAVAAELAKPQRAAAVPEELHDPERIVKGFWAWVATNTEGPRCLVHFDAHIGNLYLEPGDAPRLCDWQTIRHGRPTLDVSYLIGSALTPEQRRASERDLVRDYGDRLAAAAGDAPDARELWFDYRRDMTYGFFAWLNNLDVFQPEEINVATMGRFAAAVLDLESEAAVTSRR